MLLLLLLLVLQLCNNVEAKRTTVWVFSREKVRQVAILGNVGDGLVAQSVKPLRIGR